MALLAGDNSKTTGLMTVMLVVNSINQWLHTKCCQCKNVSNKLTYYKFSSNVSIIINKALLCQINPCLKADRKNHALLWHHCKIWGLKVKNKTAYISMQETVKKKWQNKNCLPTLHEQDLRYRFVTDQLGKLVLSLVRSQLNFQTYSKT